MFLLVPAHPGFPGQIPQSRKTVVLCVCVCSLMAPKRALQNILGHKVVGLFSTLAPTFRNGGAQPPGPSLPCSAAPAWTTSVNRHYYTPRVIRRQRIRHTPVSVYGLWFLERRYLEKVVVDEVPVADTALPTVVQSVAHATSAVVVADHVTTDRVRLTVKTPHTTFVYILTHACTYVRSSGPHPHKILIESILDGLIRPSRKSD